MLKDLDLHIGYNSEESENILKDFYIPVLSNSKEYWRLTGYFSSGSIRVAAIGIRRLIQNGGTMKLITGVEFSATDKKAIEDGTLEIEEAVTQNISKVIEDLNESDFTLQPARILGLMLKKNILEIKIANLTDVGIAHPKIGILFDEKEDSISFSGSNNETARGWKHNIEEFKVFKEWEPVQFDYYQKDKILFSKFWHKQTNRCKVYDLPEAIKQKLIVIAPDNFEEIDLGYDDGVITPPQTLSIEDLWPHQKLALQAWLNPTDWQNNLDPELSSYLQNQSTQQRVTTNHVCQGILSMATGAGKTRVGVAAALQAANTVITIIALPLAIKKQWEYEIRKWEPNVKIIYAGDEDSNWAEQLPGALGVYRFGKTPAITSRLFILGSYNTIGSTRFVQLFKGIPSQFIQFIGDEVHNFAETYANAFNIDADRVLGLSATHTRHWDDPGTKEIVRYFGEPVYDFTIQDGIDNGFLCHYNYFIHFVNMTQNELRDYRELTADIGMYSSQAKKASGPERARLESLVNTARNQRAIILRKAENKPEVVGRILEAHFSGDKEKAIIFCEDEEQLVHIKHALRVQNKTRFYYSSSIPPDQRHANLKRFKEATSSVFLLGIKMLDEGLDVPDSDKCIIVASTTNPRQFIQRRGRVLRISDTAPNKVAEIHDVVILPDHHVPSRSLTKQEEKESEQIAKIVQKELDRVLDLTKSSDNSIATITQFRNWVTSHNLQEYVQV